MTQPAPATQRAGPPVLPPTGMLVDFNLVPAVVNDKPSLQLYAACRVPGEFIRYYGGSLEKAAFIAAIDRKTGATFVATAALPHTTPLDMTRILQAPPPKKEDPEILSGEQSFAVDLATHLALPPEGGDYAVVVWIDSLVSRVKLAQVPPNPNRLPRRTVPAIPAALGPVSFRARKKDLPKPLAGNLVAVGSFEEQPFGIGHVYAAVGPAIYPKDAKTPFLTLFASVFATREVVSSSILLPADTDPDSGFSFDYEAGSLFAGTPQDRRKTFTFIVTDLTTSPVITLDPKR